MTITVASGTGDWFDWRDGVMRLHKGKQIGPIDDEVRALIAIVGPILAGLLSNLRESVAKSAGGRNNISLELFARAHRSGDGDAGICFEHAVHDAIAREDPMVMERIAEALKKCHVSGADPRSILFGLEKDGAMQIIDTAKRTLTDDSLLLHGRKGAPIKLKKHIDGVALAFRSRDARGMLPASISGLWRADLMVGTESDKWVGTTVKNQREKLAEAAGLRIGIYPNNPGESDVVRKQGNLILCPLDYDQNFVQLYYEAFDIVRAFFRAGGGTMPKPEVLPRPTSRRVAQMLVDRCKFSVVAVIEALRVFEQPDLVSTSESSVTAPSLQGEVQQELILSPRPRRK